jgi:hypothetical protein
MTDWVNDFEIRADRAVTRRALRRSSVCCIHVLTTQSFITANSTAASQIPDIPLQRSKTGSHCVINLRRTHSVITLRRTVLLPFAQHSVITLRRTHCVITLRRTHHALTPFLKFVLTSSFHLRLGLSSGFKTKFLIRSAHSIPRPDAESNKLSY